MNTYLLIIKICILVLTSNVKASGILPNIFMGGSYSYSSPLSGSIIEKDVDENESEIKIKKSRGYSVYVGTGIIPGSEFMIQYLSRNNFPASILTPSIKNIAPATKSDTKAKISAFIGMVNLKLLPLGIVDTYFRIGLGRSRSRILASDGEIAEGNNKGMVAIKYLDNKKNGIATYFGVGSIFHLSSFIKLTFDAGILGISSAEIKYKKLMPSGNWSEPSSIKKAMGAYEFLIGLRFNI